MSDIEYTPEYISSAAVATDYGIDARQQLALLDSGKLKAYYREPGTPQFFYSGMPTKGTGVMPKETRLHKSIQDCIRWVPIEEREKPQPEGEAVKCECREQYRQLTTFEISRLTFEQVSELYCERREIEELRQVANGAHAGKFKKTPPDLSETQKNEGRKRSKKQLYKMLDDAIEHYFENAPNPPSDPRLLDLEIWKYPAVKGVMRMIGTQDPRSLKAGLRRQDLGKRLPTPPGGRGKKAAR